MNAEILSFLKYQVRPHMNPISRICEIGALNVNGSAKQILHRNPDAGSTWIGLDFVPGRGVDIVGDAKIWLADKTNQFDVVVCCECYEHDPKWWQTNLAARAAIKPGGLYVVTTPGIGFPFHDFGGDYYRFTEMAYCSVIFEDFEILSLTSAEPQPSFTTVMGVARKPL